eukprot:1740700-Lingulodinium_polyedra.AAC.1
MLLAPPLRPEKRKAETRPLNKQTAITRAQPGKAHAAKTLRTHLTETTSNALASPASKTLRN